MKDVFYQKVCFQFKGELSDQRRVFDKRCVHRTHLSITHQLHGVLINTPLWSHSKVCTEAHLFKGVLMKRCVV